MSTEVAIEYQMNDEWPDLESTAAIKRDSEKKAAANKAAAGTKQHSAGGSNGGRIKWEKVDIDFNFCGSANSIGQAAENNKENRSQFNRGGGRRNYRQPVNQGGITHAQCEFNNTDKENDEFHQNGNSSVNTSDLRHSKQLRIRNGNNARGRKFGAETNRQFFNNQSRNNRGRYFNATANNGNRSNNFLTGKRMIGSNQGSQNMSRRYHSSDNRRGIYANGPNMCQYPTGVPLMIAPVFTNQQIDPSKSGLLTTVSAGTIGGKQILFVPTSPNTTATTAKTNVSSSANSASIPPTQLPGNMGLSNSPNMASNVENCQSASECGVLPGTTNIQQFFSGTPGLPSHVSITEHLVISQVDYYFSENNLYKDQFLRSKMDPDAWVDLAVINGFKKLLGFGFSIEELGKVISKSSQVEVDLKGLRIRPALNPTKWTMLPRSKQNSINNVNSTAAHLNPNAPEFVPQHDAMDDVSSQDDSAFLSQKLDSKSNSVSSSLGAAPGSTSNSATATNKPLSIQDRQRLALQAKNNAKLKGRQRLNSSMMSEEDVDDTMLSYLFIISPDSPDTSPDHSDALSTSVPPSRQPAVPNTTRHPAGDRQPFFLTRSKMNTELEEMIRFGLEEYETEYRNKTGFRSRASSTTSDSKVNLISRQEFEALSQTLLDTHASKQQQPNLGMQQSQQGSSQHKPPPPPPPPMSTTAVSNKQGDGEFIDTFGPICPTIIGIPTAVDEVAYPPGAYMYFPPAAAGQPAHMTLLPQVPLSVSLCDTSQTAVNRTGETIQDDEEGDKMQGELPTPTCDDQPQPLKPILKLKHDSTSSAHHRHGHASKKSSARQIVGFFPAGSDRYATTKKRRQRLYSEGENMQLETHVGFAFDTRSHNAALGTENRSRNASTSSEPEAMTPTANRPITSVSSGIPSSDVSHFGLRNHRSHAILKSHGFTLHGYTKFRQYALKDREINGMGLSQEMNTLYRFWSFFLRENFNKSMFQEFRSLALEDAQSGCCGSRYGLECLFRFYSYGLELRFRSSLLRNFQEDTLRDYEQFGNKYGLEKFWAFLHYSGRQAVDGTVEHAKSGMLDVGPKLCHLLQQYSTLEDLRADFKPPDGFFIDRTRIGSEK